MSSRDLNTFMAWFLKGECDHPTIDRCDKRSDTLDARNWQIRARHGDIVAVVSPMTQRLRVIPSEIV
jgi:hypothetical protein